VDGLPPFTASNAEKAAEAAWRLIIRIIRNNSHNNLLDRGVHIPLKVLKTATQIIECIGEVNVHCSLCRDVFAVSFLDKALVMNVYCECDQVMAFVYGAKCCEFTISGEEDMVVVVEFISN